jgi:hypothetical protein
VLLSVANAFGGERRSLCVSTRTLVVARSRFHLSLVPSSRREHKQELV